MRAVTIALYLAGVVQAHYHFPYLITGSGKDTVRWKHVRQVKNPDSNDFVSGGPTSPDIRCYQNGKKAETGTVAAGGTLGIGASQGVFHPGPIQFYMAKAPDGVDIANWDGAGNVWFKTYSEKPPASRLGETASWSSGNKQDFTFTVPKSTPSGDYLVRIEHIALHNTGKPQIYVACGQVKVTNGGSGTPGPLVAFPGVYAANDPGVVFNLYGGGQYKAPGPAVWTG
ncbi:hypothetical protein OQA88_3175 [Cercophora sp. LCS_1]